MRAFVHRNNINKGLPWWILFLLVVLNLLVFQFVTLRNYEYQKLNNNPKDRSLLRSNREGFIQRSSSSSSSSSSDKKTPYILTIPKGKAIALASIRTGSSSIENEEESLTNSTSFTRDKRYGGKGDKGHLGGFTDLDHMGISPMVWKWMLRSIGVHSLVDVGCGRGISTSWFYDHGLTTEGDLLCVEGSHDAVEQTVLPHPQRQIVEHDFSRGSWYPERTFDAVWCVEFLEHVGRNLQKNYIPIFRKSALLFLSHSNWGGHHHVEVHDDQFWINKFTMFGFVYSEELTLRVRKLASLERRKGVAPNGMLMNAQHIWLTMVVFINPTVAALPQHSHLLTDCDINCAFESPITITPQQDEVWYQRITSRISQKTPSVEDQLKIDQLKIDQLKIDNTIEKEKEDDTIVPEYEKLFNDASSMTPDMLQKIVHLKDEEYFQRTMTKEEGK